MRKTLTSFTCLRIEFGEFRMARKHIPSHQGHLGYLLIISQGYQSLYEKDEKVTDQTWPKESWMLQIWLFLANLNERNGMIAHDLCRFFLGAQPVEFCKKGCLEFRKCFQFLGLPRSTKCRPNRSYKMLEALPKFQTRNLHVTVPVCVRVGESW